MASENRSFRPLLWVSEQARNNVVVLSADMLHLASVKKADLARIDLGLEDGEPAETLLPAKAWKIPLHAIAQFELKQVRRKSAFEEWMNNTLTVTYLDRSKMRTLKITLASEAIRDEVVQNLNDRVGHWEFSEVAVSAMLLLARYLYIIAVFALLTIFFCWLELSDVWNRQGAGGATGRLLNRYFDAFGIWGIFAPGLFVCVMVMIAGVRQLQLPPIFVRYEPETDFHERT
jgi:hypothetical protein